MAELVKAWDGHYTVEFESRGNRYYIENDFDVKGNRDLRIYSEQEYLLADEPEPLFRIWEKGEESGLEGEPPCPCFDVEEAMEIGKQAANSGIVHLSMGR